MEKRIFGSLTVQGEKAVHIFRDPYTAAIFRRMMKKCGGAGFVKKGEPEELPSTEG